MIVYVASFLGNNGAPSLSYKTHREKIVIKPQGGDLGSIMPVCLCPKVKEMGSFSASSE